MLNKVMLIGNLGKDPEIRATQNGTQVASFSIVTSEKWVDKASGERKDRTDWHSIVVFNPHLIDRIITPYLKKGSKVYVEGRLQTRKWQDQSGTDRYTTEVVLQNFNGTLLLLGDTQSSNRPPLPTEAADYGTTRQTSTRPATDAALDSEIPF